MQEAAVATPSGMVAIMGADEAAVDKLCAEAAAGRGAGAGELQRAGADRRQRRDRRPASGSLQAAEAAGFKAMPLKVAGAFHSPLMQPAADRMQAELEQGRVRSRRGRTVYSNVTAAAARRCRRRSSGCWWTRSSQPVRWEQTMQTLVARGRGAVRRAGARADAGGAGQADQPPAAGREPGDGRCARSGEGRADAQDSELQGDDHDRQTSGIRDRRLPRHRRGDRASGWRRTACTSWPWRATLEKLQQVVRTRCRPRAARPKPLVCDIADRQGARRR